MSLASVYFFDPVKNALARLVSSNTSSAPQKAAAQAALDTYNKLAVDAPAAVSSILAGQSPAAAASPIVADLETGLYNVVANYGGALIAGVPIVGPVISAEAVALIKTGLVFGEQHAHDLLAGFYASLHAKVEAMAIPAPQSPAALQQAA